MVIYYNWGNEMNQFESSDGYGTQLASKNATKSVTLHRKVRMSTITNRRDKLNIDACRKKVMEN